MHLDQMHITPFFLLKTAFLSGRGVWVKKVTWPGFSSIDQNKSVYVDFQHIQNTEDPQGSSRTDASQENLGANKVPFWKVSFGSCSL